MMKNGKSCFLDFLVNCFFDVVDDRFLGPFKGTRKKCVSSRVPDLTKHLFCDGGPMALQHLHLFMTHKQNEMYHP